MTLAEIRIVKILVDAALEAQSFYCNGNAGSRSARSASMSSRVHG